MTDSTKPIYPEPQHFPEVLFEEPAQPESNYTGQTTGMQPPVMASMPHVEHTYTPEIVTCVRCGSRNIAKGYVVDYGDKFEQVRFAPKRLSLRWLNSIFNLHPWSELPKLRADACRDCGAVMLVVDPEELRKAERVRE